MEALEESAHALSFSPLAYCGAAKFAGGERTVAVGVQLCKRARVRFLGRQQSIAVAVSHGKLVRDAFPGYSFALDLPCLAKVEMCV